MNDHQLSNRLISQRVHNRLLEYAESILSFNEDPSPADLNDLINEWEDWTGWEHPIKRIDFPRPVYTDKEFNVLLRLDLIWKRLCDTTPQTIVDEAHVLSSQEWFEFVDAASLLYTVFKKRGMLPEDEEIW